MSHFATHGSSLSPAEGELALALDACDAARPDDFWFIGLMLIGVGPRVIAVAVAALFGFEVDVE